VFKAWFGIILLATALIATFTVAQAGTKTASFSICAGSGCQNNASQHNFTQPGSIKVPTGLPASFTIQRVNISCATFCSHAALWPQILVEPGSDGSYVTLNAHHTAALNASSNYRTNVYTLNIWLHY
jgi:hypothetical protein